MKTPYAIIIMDGYGINKDTNGNAVYADGSKNVTALEKEYPSSQLGASGMSVGLPDGQMGNSEVGHLNIGAGRIVYQDLTKITKDIRDGSFFENKELLPRDGRGEGERQKTSSFRTRFHGRGAQSYRAPLRARRNGEKGGT